MPLVSTIPSAKDSRNLAGRVRRLLSSIVCSYSPRSIQLSFSSPLRTTLTHIGPQRNSVAPRKGQFLRVYGVSCAAYGPRPVRTAAPQRAASSTASSGDRPDASPKVSPAPKQSPQPYASSTGPGSGAARYGPPGFIQPPSAPAVVTTSFGRGSRSPGP